MLGQRLLRLLYRRVPIPLEYYDGAARRACSRIVVDAGGGTGLLYKRLSGVCMPGYYILLEVDEGLIEGFERDAISDAVVADARRPPLRRARGSTMVLNDALHHIRGWRGSLCAILEPAECIVVHDYNVSTWKGRLLALLEKLLGFPAEFTTPERLAEHLARCGYRVVELEEGFAYTVRACSG